MSPSPWQLAIIVVVLVLLFGAKKLPDAARSIGRSMKIFKAETKGMRDEESTEDSADSTGSSASSGSSEQRSSAEREAPQLQHAKATRTDQPGESQADDSEVEDLERQLNEAKQRAGQSQPDAN